MQFESKSDALEALVLANHASIPNPGQYLYLDSSLKAGVDLDFLTSGKIGGVAIYLGPGL